MRKKYFIAVVVNEKYLIHMFVMLSSLFYQNGGKSFCVFIFHSFFSDDSLCSIKNFFEKEKQEYKEFLVDEKPFRKAPVLDHNMSLEAYYKLIIPLYLPNEVDKLIYLDSDIIINGDIGPLYEMDLGDKAIGGVRDFAMDRDIPYKTSLMSENEIYINSGVLLFEMKRFRKYWDLNQIIEYIEKHGQDFRFHDQEVINALYHAYIMPLREEFNYLTMFRKMKDQIKIWNKPPENIIVVHYALSDNKPWFALYRGKYLWCYWKYRNKLYGHRDYIIFLIKRTICMPVRGYYFLNDVIKYISSKIHLKIERCNQKWKKV